jgi:hypothetical protein
MTELSDYKRMVEAPMLAQLRKRIAELEAENERLSETQSDLLEALEEYMSYVALDVRCGNADIITIHEAAERMEAARVRAEAAIAQHKGQSK